MLRKFGFELDSLWQGLLDGGGGTIKKKKHNMKKDMMDWAMLGNGTKVPIFPMATLDDKFNIKKKLKRRRFFVSSNGNGSSSGSFHTCSLCLCCDDNQSICTKVPCCFSIVCNVPNLPFGLCSFTPSTCNCLSC